MGFRLILRCAFQVNCACSITHGTGHLIASVSKVHERANEKDGGLNIILSHFSFNWLSRVNSAAELKKTSTKITCEWNPRSDRTPTGPSICQWAQNNITCPKKRHHLAHASVRKSGNSSSSNKGESKQRVRYQMTLLGGDFSAD